MHISREKGSEALLAANSQPICISRLEAEQENQTLRWSVGISSSGSAQAQRHPSSGSAQAQGSAQAGQPKPRVNPSLPHDRDGGTAGFDMGLSKWCLDRQAHPDDVGNGRMGWLHRLGWRH